MTTEEFSNELDVLLYSYSDEKNSLLLDEYEKSVILTQSQYEVFLNHFNNYSKGKDSAFEESEESRRALSSLITEYISDVHHTSYVLNDCTVMLPDDVHTILVEWADVANYGRLQVVPTTWDEFHRIQNNPFRGASNSRILRLDSDNNIILISKNKINKYYCIYLKTLKPIITTKLPEGVSIDGFDTVTECELPEFLHKEILKKAISTILNTRSEGNINNKSQE